MENLDGDEKEKTGDVLGSMIDVFHYTGDQVISFSALTHYTTNLTQSCLLVIWFGGGGED